MPVLPVRRGQLLHARRGAFHAIGGSQLQRRRAAAVGVKIDDKPDPIHTALDLTLIRSGYMKG
jgi:hypothetical protein